MPLQHAVHFVSRLNAEQRSALETLDVAVANHLGNDSVTLAVWKRDRRVVYTGRTRTETPEPAAPPATAA